jgi:hypothetical protein
MKILSLRPAWATEQEPLSQKKKMIRTQCEFLIMMKIYIKVNLKASMKWINVWENKKFKSI